MFKIVMFPDGLQLVPDSWILPDGTTCFWPHQIKDGFKINKLIAAAEEPDESWKILNIEKICGQADTYVKGIQKVKMCQKTSDVDTESDDGKHRRKLLCKRTYDTDSDEDLQPSLNSNVKQLLNYPPVPKKLKKNTEIKNLEGCSLRFSSLLESTSFSPIVGSEVPEVTINQPTTKGAHQLDNQITSEGSIQPDKSFSNEREETQSLPGLDSQVQISAPSFQMCCCTKLEKNTKILEKLLHKTNYLITKVNAMGERLDNKVDKEDNIESDIRKSFPFENVEDFGNFDNALKDEEFYKNLVKSLKAVGGIDANRVVVNILKCAISNRVGEMYSWAGAKQKKSFKNCHFVKAIIETTRLAFPNITEDEIGKWIAEWLRHAKQRRERAEGKKDVVAAQV